MSIYALTTRERKACLNEFHGGSADLLSGHSESSKFDDISQISFVEFCKYLNFRPTLSQQKLVHFTFSQRVTNAPAAHGVGKSMISSVLVLYATICKRSLVISTAPTRRQVESIIWRNVNDLFIVLKRNKSFKHRFGIDLRRDYTIGQTFLRQIDIEQVNTNRKPFWFEKLAFDDVSFNELNNDDPLGYAFGFTSRKDTSSFQGLHAPRLLMILDEATGVEDIIHEAALSCVTGSGNHVLKIGNPTERGVAFYRSCVQDGCFAISAFDHPNVAPFYEFQSNGMYKLIDDSCLDPSYVDPMPGAVSPRWIEEAIKKYGENSLFVRTRIYAKFPMLGQGTSTLIPPSLIAKAVEDYPYNDSHLMQFTTAPLVVGLDVGDVGDASVLSIGQWMQEIDLTGKKSGWLCVRGIYERLPSEAFDGLEQQRIYDWAQALIESFRSATYINEDNVFLQIDSTGLGSGMVKDFKLNTKYNITAVHFAAAAVDAKSYVNIRTEMYFFAARLYEKSIIRYFQSLGTDEVEELHYQFSGISYETDLRNERKRLISKELIRQILGRSPDHADANVLMCKGLSVMEIDV
jgi:hypothetical protein